MNQNNEMALKEAFSLIEAGNLDDAKALLRPILESEKDNADVWWLYSHAVTDAETARLALNNVLRIDPDYPDARDLLNQLETQQKVDQFDDILEMGKDPAFIPPMPSTVPGIMPLASRGDSSAARTSDPLDDLPDEMFDDEPEAFYRRPLFYIPLITLLLLVALAIVIFKPFAVNSPVPQTAQTTQLSFVETPTSETTVSNENTTLTPIQTSQTETPLAVQSLADLSTITNAFTSFTLRSENGVEIVDTTLGKTLVVNVCTTAGKAMREILPKSMDTLAKVSLSFTGQTQIVAVKMLDCDANSTLLWLGATMEDAVAFANGTLTEKEFQAKWKPVK